jgi:hypothetical protein
MIFLVLEKFGAFDLDFGATDVSDTPLGWRVVRVRRDVVGAAAFGVLNRRGSASISEWKRAAQWNVSYRHSRMVSIADRFSGDWASSVWGRRQRPACFCFPSRLRLDAVRARVREMWRRVLDLVMEIHAAAAMGSKSTVHRDMRVLLLMLAPVSACRAAPPRERGWR